MLILCSVLIVLLCASLMACAYLYAERRRLNNLVTRQDALLVKQDAERADWINKALARNSMTPLGEEREEKVSGQAAKSEAFDLKPPIARMQEEWDREEDEELARVFPLPSEVRSDLLEGAREAAS